MKKRNVIILSIVAILLVSCGVLAFCLTDKKSDKQGDITTTVKTTTAAIENEETIVEGNVIKRTLKQCDLKDCDVYKSNILRVTFSNNVKVVEGNEEYIKSDIYINGKMALNVKFYLDYSYDEPINAQVIDNKYVFIKFSNPGAIYEQFYLFDLKGNLINDFSKYVNVYGDKYTLFVQLDNNNFNLNYYYTDCLENSVSLYLEENPKLKDEIYKIEEVYKVSNNKLVLSSTKKVTFTTAAKAETVEDVNN